MNPRTLSLCGMNGLARMRLIDWRTSSSRSEKDSREKWGFIPTSSWICPLTSSSEKVSIPQSVWWMRMISRVPKRRWEMVSARISSSHMYARARRGRLGDGRRAALFCGYAPAGVGDHVRVALLETEHPIDVEPGIHAGH